MTLIIAAGNQDQFIQVSDRRLTVNGVIADDESNKAIVLQCANARLAVGFTGLARIGTFNTGDWILSALNECGPPDYTAQSIIERFTGRATKDFTEIKQLGGLSAEHSRLSIAFTGYLDHHDPPLGALAVVSNFHNLDTGIVSAGSCGHFECFFREEPRPHNGQLALFFPLGTLPPIPEADSRMLVDLVKSRKPARAIVGKLLDLFGKLADDATSRNVIGKQLNSIVLPRNRKLGAESGYHSEKVVAESYMPDQVYVVSDKLHMNVKDISIRPADPGTTPPLSGPKLRPNQLCWCNSGKKYRKCHGRPNKRGAKFSLKVTPDE